MINLEQIRLLETKIDKAAARISALKEENKKLTDSLGKSEARLKELDALVQAFKNDQNKIEQGILNAIKKLDNLEDEISEKLAASSDSALKNEPVKGTHKLPVLPTAESVESDTEIPEAKQPDQELDIF